MDLKEFREQCEKATEEWEMTSLPCPTCPRMMDARSTVCHKCAVAVQKKTFTIPKRRQPVIMPYRESRKPGKKFR